jgi:hypothetical protein
MAPRQGHFEAALHLFGYLKAFPKGSILIDQTPYLKPEATFTDYDWTDFYPDAEEELPPDMPPPLPTTYDNRLLRRFRPCARHYYSSFRHWSIVIPKRYARQMVFQTTKDR